MPVSSDTEWYALLTYEKTGLMRFLSHLEIAAFFDRAVRRSGIDVEYSKGFTPRARILFPMPLPVGAEGTNEFCAIELERHYEPSKLSNVLAPEFSTLPVSDIEMRERGSKSLFTKLEAASYEAKPSFAELVSSEQLTAAVEDILDRDELVIPRETKTRVRKIDIRPHIYHLEAQPDGTLSMCLGFTQETLVKPDEVLSVAASRLEVAEASGWDRLVRTGLHFQRPDFDNNPPLCDQ